MARLLRSLSPAIVLAVVVLAFGGVAAQPPQAPDFSGLEAVVRQELADTNTPGAALAVVRGDRVVYAKGFGVASVETGAPVTPEMLFRLGSTTKMFTSAAVVSLAEEGKLRMDAPVGQYVSGLDPSLARLTAGQLLNHSAGLRDEAVMFGPHDDPALGQGVRTMTKNMFFAEPGRVFSYSNPGFWIAGHLAETVDGRPYADMMLARLFKPLGMARTTLRPLMAMTWPLALGHDVVEGKVSVVRPAADNVANWPAGSIFSSVEDLSRFVIAFLNDGRVGEAQALSRSLIETLSTPRVDMPGSDGSKYGYGLTIVTRRGVRFVEHGGSRSGYGSTIAMAPENRVGVIVLANRTGVGMPKTVAKTEELMLPLQAETPRKPGAPVAMAPDEVDRYAGQYRQAGSDAGVEVLRKDRGIALKAGNQETPIVKVGPNRFEIIRRNGDVEDVTFVLDAGGRAEFLYRGTRALARK